MAVFTRFLSIDVPTALTCEPNARNPAFEIAFAADGEIPFPQVILHAPTGDHVIKGGAIRRETGSEKGGAPSVSYVATIASGLTGAGKINVQVEGCRKGDGGADCPTPDRASPGSLGQGTKRSGRVRCTSSGRTPPGWSSAA